MATTAATKEALVTRRLGGAVFVALALVAGCSYQTAIRRPSAAHFDSARRDELWSRTLNTLQRRGWIIAVSDRSGGLVTTQPMLGSVACGIMTCSIRDTIQVTLTESGDAIVNLHREFRSPVDSQAGWFPVQHSAGVAAIEAEQDQLMLEIVGVQPAPRSPQQSS